MTLPIEQPPEWMTVAEFCQRWNMPRSTYELFRSKGRGPEIVQPAGHRGRVWITAEAERNWAIRYGGYAPRLNLKKSVSAA